MTIIGTPIASSDLGDESYIETTVDLESRLSDDPRASAIALAAATTAAQSWYLKKATASIDALSLKGTTYYYIDTVDPDDEEQSLQFPRIINGVACDWDDSTDAPVVPEAVKKACVEEAIALYSYYTSDGNTKRTELQAAGVKSFSVGKLSESYGPKSLSRSRGLMSEEAFRLMKPYIAGSVRPIP